MSKVAMAVLIFLFIIGCKEEKQYSVGKSLKAWQTQIIDSVKACDILLSDRIRFIKVGSYYTASIKMEGGQYFYKSNKGKVGLDFTYRDKDIHYYKDTCELKEELREFMFSEIVKSIPVTPKNH